MKPVILCIDDEPIVLKSLMIELKQVFSEEYSIETASSGEEALEFIEELQEEGTEIPVIITDYIMPKMRGDVLLSEIHETHPETLKVMLSGHSELDGVINAINSAHLYRFLSKPWQKEDLVLTIREASKKYYQTKLVREQNEELKQKNEKLEDLNANLESIIQERTAELEKKSLELENKNKELSQINNVKDKLFSIVSHDIKGPLSSLQSVLFLMSREAISQTDLKRISEDISNHVSATIGFLESLLQWAKAQLQGINVKPEKLNLHELAWKSSFLLKSESDKKKISIINKVDDTIYVFADEEMARLILRNLINNAIKFTPKNGSGQITIKGQATDDDFIEVSVSDNGKGISADNIPKLFELDAGLSTAGTEKQKGTGLGLSLCKDLTEKQGGKIWVESKVNEGSTFYFTLPSKELS